MNLNRKTRETCIGTKIFFAFGEFYALNILARHSHRNKNFANIYLWREIKMNNETYIPGEWVDGYYKPGTWIDGYYRPGEWIDGYHKPGEWVDGYYYGGHWVDGYYDGGYWVDGYYEDGEDVYVPGEYILDEGGNRIRERKYEYDEYGNRVYDEVPTGEYVHSGEYTSRDIRFGDYIFSVPVGASDSEIAALNNGDVPSGMNAANVTNLGGGGNASLVYRLDVGDTTVWAWVQRFPGNKNTVWVQIGDGDARDFRGEEIGSNDSFTIEVDGTEVFIKTTGNNQIDGSSGATIQVPIMIHETERIYRYTYGDEYLREAGNYEYQPGEWVDGFWNPGEWVDGYWNPGEWIDGHYTPGEWVDGHYIPGEWVDGHYVPGEWVPGYYIPGEWVPGQPNPDTPTFPEIPGGTNPSGPTPPTEPPAVAESQDTVTIDDTPVPLEYFDEPTDDPTELITLDDTDVHLANFPYVPDDYIVSIENASVPLSEMPQTGLESAVGALTTGLMLSAFTAAVVAGYIRKLKRAK